MWNTAPVLEYELEDLAFAGLGILNSMVFDWLARRMTSGLHLNKFVLEGLVWPVLDDVSLATVAHAAWSICKARPRSGLTERRHSSPRPVRIQAALGPAEAARSFSPD